MYMMKKLSVLLLALLALTACQDEPKSDEGAVETITVNGVSFNMVKVKGGSLTMNMELITDWGVDYQDSTLDVTLADYSIGQTEVTQGLWLAVMGSNPSYFTSSNMAEQDIELEDDLNRPVENVWWDDCQAFIEKLNELTGRHFRIPTDAEWEFAARGGNKTHGYTYAGSEDIDEVAWSQDNSDGRTHPVGQKKPNELGLYDMSGNVCEFCLNSFQYYWYDGTSYIIGIYRGGSYYKNCTVWNHGWFGYLGYGTNRTKASYIGLRLAE